MMKKNCMKKAALKIDELAVIEELSIETASAISGGRIKLETVRPGPVLTSPDGEPVSVYVDGVLINSVSTGYAG